MLSHRERQVAPFLDWIHPGHVRRYEFAATLIGGKVLDAACGVGYGSQLMKKTGAHVIGIDLEEEAINYAQKHYPGPEYFVDDVCTHEGIYDWGVAFEILEHLMEPKAMLKNLNKRCRKILVSTPNEEYFRFIPMNYEGDRFPHVMHYRPAELDKLLAETGWEVTGRYCQPSKTSPVEEGTNGMFMIYVAH